MSAALLGLAFAVEAPSPAAKLVLLKLVDCARDDGRHIYPSKATIAKAAQCSERHVATILKDFCAVGLLRRVRDGGSGPGSTAHYELCVVSLRRFADDGWPADGASHDAGACEGAAQDHDPAPDKGELSSPLSPERVKPATAKGEVQFTQPLSESLKGEREGAPAHTRETGAGSAEPQAAAHAPEAGPTLSEFRKLWPTSFHDNQAQVENAWAELPFEQRRAAVESVKPYLAELKRTRKDHPPPGWRYLRERLWAYLPKMRDETRALEAVTIEPWSRPWWALLFRRIEGRQSLAFFLENAKAGKPWAARGGDVPGEAETGRLVPFTCDGAEIAAWRPWLEDRGARLPDFSGRFRVFLPGPAPPPA